MEIVETIKMWIYKETKSRLKFGKCLLPSTSESFVFRLVYNDVKIKTNLLIFIVHFTTLLL
jgi:hypothetical protein